MMDRDTLEQDLDRVLGGLEPEEPVGEWDWEPPLGSAGPPSQAASIEPVEPEGSDESEEPGDGSEEDQGSEDQD